MVSPLRSIAPESRDTLMSSKWRPESSGNLRLPSNWKRLRRFVLYRDRGVCQIAGPDCTSVATEVDHIVNNDDHSPNNLRAVCATCHRQRTEVQRRDGLARANARRFRPPDPHPGAVP